MTQRLEDLGLIGNCQYSALVDRTGAVVWCCLPRFDSEPVFARLLDVQDGGHFSVGLPDGGTGEQRYLPNSNVLETRFSGPDGAFRVLDFAPRFIQYDRVFRPTQMVRIVEPLSGMPRVSVHCDPRLGWTKGVPAQLIGSNHVRYEGFGSQLRLTSDVPPSYLTGQAFALTERRHLLLSWGAPVEEALAPLCDRFLTETTHYWQRWVKHCNVPPLFQQEVIRSALVLKLHCFEDTGAIVAAMTTSIPESPGSGRTWDYRYCWLRDAYYALAAFRLLGHFEERERFVEFLLNIAGGSPNLDLAPLYRVDGTLDLDERILPNWPGWNGEGPVRIGNGAAKQAQNDIFGEMVLALAPIFLDERFSGERSPASFDLLERLTRKAISLAGKPDAGIWEYRTEGKPQTFSSVMSWAAADRMARVCDRVAPRDAAEFRAAAERIREEVLRRAWCANQRCFTASYDNRDLDSSLLQLAGLRFLPAADPRLGDSITAMWEGLRTDGWLRRYRLNDGFGEPTVAFVICTFWLVEALVKIRDLASAREVFEMTRGALSPLGLLSEDFDPVSRRLWGNFPQAYSHVGLIHAAFDVSPRWAELL